MANIPIGDGKLEKLKLRGALFGPEAFLMGMTFFFWPDGDPDDLLYIPDWSMTYTNQLKIEKKKKKKDNTYCQLKLIFYFLFTLILFKD